MFKKLVQDELVRFYKSELWEGFLEQISLDKGVRHAHLFMDSALNPSNILKLTRAYFEGRGNILRRSIWLVSDGPGLANCYYIAPQDKCHFEILLRHNTDVVIEPMPDEHSIGGKVIDIWDDVYMERYYRGFRFRPLDDASRAQVEAFFRTSAWNQLLETMVYNVQRNKHGHLIARLGVHPRDVADMAVNWLRKRGWKVDRAVDVTFRGDVGGALNDDSFEYAKITILVSQPETVLEIEWEYDPEVVIEPQPFGIARIISTDRIKSDIGSIPYYTLTDLELAAVAERIG